MTRYAMAVDLDRCVGCQACVIACKAENNVGRDHFRLRVGEVVFGEAARPQVEFLHAQCYHCENPMCVPVCPTGATFRDAATGTVEIEIEKCIGCKACVVACPYGMRHIDPAGGWADKCSLCKPRRAEGLGPACVDVCPSNARIFGDLDDPAAFLTRLLAGAEAAGRLQVDRPELGLKPKLFLLGSRYEGRRS